jgi:pimeloyl-ACP methyl ester carboxylesterase
MKKFLKILAAIVIIVPLLAFGWLTYSTQKNHAVAGDDALAALVSNEVVDIETGDWIVMRPSGAAPRAGLIFYPGAYCDIRGYAPILREVAAQGYLVIAVSMPFDFSIFAPNSADEVRAAFPEIEDWVLAGHSMGGASAARYAYYHQDDVAGLILWDSNPSPYNSLADSKLPVMHIHRATLDGTAPQRFLDEKGLFPADSKWVPVPGGMHLYYGSFIGGGYVEQQEPGIEREAQIEIATNATLDALKFMTAR